ncbi:hypothetical protein GHT06_017084 [Daphnia sinensis]|uniref:Uncharacterized protein n=1 Tax=Daphnia sinensis TaxID=1820382 RepID=A0AAD5L730_9CRUS|nr:hypothetical protein GHT06_017084 [Daphnia sinensis]
MLRKNSSLWGQFSRARFWIQASVTFSFSYFLYEPAPIGATFAVKLVAVQDDWMVHGVPCEDESAQLVKIAVKDKLVSFDRISSSIVRVLSQKMGDVMNSTVATRTNQSQVHILTFFSEYSSGTSKRIGISLINSLYRLTLTEDPKDRLVLLDSNIKKITSSVKQEINILRAKIKRIEEERTEAWAQGNVIFTLETKVISLEKQLDRMAEELTDRENEKMTLKEQIKQPKNHFRSP